MDTRLAIVQSICVYEILMKRKTQIDHLAEGLSEMGFINLLSTFPTVMQPLFVGGVKVPAGDEFFDLLKVSSASKDLKTYMYVQRCLLELDEDGKC